MNEHAGHSVAHADHSGHEQMFRRKFWVSLLLSIPVILYSMGLQMMLGVALPAFPGSQWIAPIFGAIVFLYGGLPFLQMAVPEIKNRQPGMMTLISLAITVAFVYSAATLALLGRLFLQCLQWAHDAAGPKPQGNQGQQEDRDDHQQGRLGGVPSGYQVLKRCESVAPFLF